MNRYWEKRRYDDENHARTYWTAATRGLQLPEEVFSGSDISAA